MFFAPHPLYVQHMLRGISDFSLFFIHSHTITDWSPFKIQNTLLSQGPRNWMCFTHWYILCTTGPTPGMKVKLSEKL